MNAVASVLASVADQPWIIPAIGLAVGGLAFLTGRRLLLARRGAPAPPDPANAVGVRMPTVKAREDRRTAPRRKGNRVAVYLTDGSNRPPLCAWVVDRSLGGLCLVVEKPLAEGTVLNVRPRQAPQTAPWTPIEVRSCRADDGEWEVGCRFCKAPQWNDLLLFG
jgi:PilZ domain